MNTSTARHQPGRPFILTLGVTIAAGYVLQTSGPIVLGPHIQPVPAVSAAILAIAGFKLLADLLWLLGTLLSWLQAVMPTGLKGTSGLIKSLRELKDELIENGRGQYWGFFKGREVISDTQAVSVVVGTTGSNKTTGMALPNALSIRDAKVIFDFKGSSTCQLVRPLRERGERVRILNFADKYKDILGETNHYNPMCVITDCFGRPGGLLEVNEILEEMAHQIRPNPNSDGSGGENEYFYNGSRSLIEFVILTCCLIDGEEATLADALNLLMNRESLLHHALWACGKLPLEPENPPHSDTTPEGDEAALDLSSDTVH